MTSRHWCGSCRRSGGTRQPPADQTDQVVGRSGWSGRRNIGRSLLPEQRGPVVSNDTELLILLKADAAGNLVGVHRVVGPEGEVREPEVRATRVGEDVAGNDPVASHLQ